MLLDREMQGSQTEQMRQGKPAEFPVYSPAASPAKIVRKAETPGDLKHTTCHTRRRWLQALRRRLTHTHCTQST